MWQAAIVLEAIGLPAEIAGDAADGRVVVGVIAGAAGAADVPVAAGGIVDAADLAGEDTRTSLPRISRVHTDKKKATAIRRGLFTPTR